MKKTIAMFAAALMLLSVIPLVIAEEVTGEADNEVVSTEVTSADIQEARPLDKCITEVLEKKPETRPIMAKALCAKKIVEIRYEKLRTGYANLKEAFEAKRTAFVQGRDAFNAKRAECTLLSGAERADCVGVLKTRATNALINQAEAIIAQLAKLQDKNISIEGAELSITNLQAAIESLQDENITKETIIQAANTIKEEWAKIKIAAKKKVANAILVKFENLLAKTDRIQEKLETRITKLKDAGYDTTALETALATFKEDIATAKEKWQAAKDRYAQADTTMEISQLMKEVNAFLKNARVYLKHGFFAVKKIIISTIKAEKGEAVSETELAVEPVQETELEPEQVETAETTGTDTGTEGTATD